MKHILKNILWGFAIMVAFVGCYSLYFFLEWLKKGSEGLAELEYYSSGAYCSDTNSTELDPIALQKMEPFVRVDYLPSDIRTLKPDRRITGHDTDSGGPAQCFISLSYWSPAGQGKPMEEMLFIWIYPPAKTSETTSVEEQTLTGQWRCYSTSTSEGYSYCLGAILGPDGYSEVSVSGKHNTSTLRQIAQNIRIQNP